MSDESAYRGGSHPPYCTCVECQRRRSKHETRGSILIRILKFLRLKR